MAWVDADWSITRSNGNIRYIGDDHGGGSPSYASVIQAHRAIAAFSDDAVSSGDDEHDITDDTATDRSTDQYITLLGTYNFDDAAIEHIYGGSVVQGTGGTEVIYDGVKNYGPPTVQIQLIQNGAVITDDWWNFGGGGLNADAAQNISHQFLVKVRDAGADIDGRRILGTSRTFGETYHEFLINGSGRGENVLALSPLNDLNNETAGGTVATWDQFANDTEGYVGIDVDNDLTDEYYYSSLDIGGGATPASPTINDLFEWWKYQQRDGSAATLYDLSGELFRGITHEINVDTPTGTFNAVEAVSWSGGTGQLLAIDSTTAATKMWIQLLTGVAPTDGQTITGGTSSATNDVDTTVTVRTISNPAIGVSTGSAIIGGYGIGIDTTDLTQNDKLFDLTNTQYSPPNITTKSVGGLVVSEDYVIVSNDNGGAIDFGQFTLNGALTGGAVTSVVINGSIPVDTPNSGTIRVERDSGQYTLHPYSAWASSTFTITSHDFSTDNASNGNNTFISYLDKLATSVTESFQGVFGSPRTYFSRVRDGKATPIKPYESTFTDSGNGGGVTAIRTSDA